MQQATCPRCGSSEVHCRPAPGNLRSLAPSRLMNRGMARIVTVGAFSAICVNLFLLHAGNVTSAMAWTQISLALLLTLFAWLGAWAGWRRHKKGSQCRCLLCGERWTTGTLGAASPHTAGRKGKESEK